MTAIASLIQTDQEVMSNYDHVVREGAEELLRANPDKFYDYAGWNFHARVWWNGLHFVAEPWSYGSRTATLFHEDTLEKLMASVSAV